MADGGGSQRRLKRIFRSCWFMAWLLFYVCV
nr:hypothetical protein Iba_chr03dCG1750 [Ipomoea batatas]GMC85607.1 hypothetical protein Iba_scaffold36035CG0020 [Ipomoea batatas]GME17289.1 hypothetical protein Iba_scaffold18461CG0080 [Ipomoea batatas]